MIQTHPVIQNGTTTERIPENKIINAKKIMNTKIISNGEKNKKRGLFVDKTCKHYYKIIGTFYFQIINQA